MLTVLYVVYEIGKGKKVLWLSGGFMMKKACKGAFVTAGILIFGLVFELFSGISYRIDGTSGVLDGISVVMSTVYVLLFLLVPIWLGYKKWTSCFVAYGVLLALVGIMGAMGYLGYGFLLGGFAQLYFLLIAPFSALVEGMALSWNLYYAADRVLLLVPLAIYFFAMVSYIVGTILRAHERALHYSLMRLDSRYEYRMPLEESLEERHTA